MGMAQLAWETKRQLEVTLVAGWLVGAAEVRSVVGRHRSASAVVASCPAQRSHPVGKGRPQVCTAPGSLSSCSPSLSRLAACSSATGLALSRSARCCAGPCGMRQTGSKRQHAYASRRPLNCLASAAVHDPWVRSVFGAGHLLPRALHADACAPTHTCACTALARPEALTRSAAGPVRQSLPSLTAVCPTSGCCRGGCSQAEGEAHGQMSSRLCSEGHSAQLNQWRCAACWMHNSGGAADSSEAARTGTPAAETRSGRPTRAAACRSAGCC